MAAKISLTDEVRRSMQMHPAKGVEVEDENTQKQYVLLPIDAYRQVESLIYDTSEPDPNEFLPLVHQAFADDWNAPGMEAYDDYDRHKPSS